MKKIIFLLFVIGFISHNSFSQDQWYRTNGPSGGPINSVIETSSSKIFLGTGAGIYRSTNSGYSFSPIGLYDNQIIKIVTIKNRLFAIDGNYHIFRSSNDGAKWTDITNINMSGLFVFNDILFGITPFSGIYKSTNNGDNWTLLGLPADMDINITSFSNYLYGFRSYSLSEIYRSSDNGDSWSILQNDLPSFTGVNSFGSFNNFLFVNIVTASGSMIYKSTNSGINWTKINNWDPLNYINSFIQSGAYNMASVNNKGIYRSSDNGVNWTLANNGLSRLNSIILTKGANRIYGSINEYFSTGALFQSSNAGNSWSELTTGLTTGNILDMVLMNSNILAATSNGLFKSTNEGSTWTQSNYGLNSSSVSTLALKENTSTVYAGTNDSGLYVSKNFGSSWIHTNFNTENVYSISISGSNIYAGTSYKGVYISTNNGTTWTQTSLTGTRVSTLASKGKYVYAGWINTHGKPHGGIFISTDKGITWAAGDIPDGRVSSIGVFDNDFVIASTDIGVYRSTNYGLNWSIVNSGTIIGVPANLVVMGYGDVYVANSNGVAGSYNYGKTWELVSYGLLSKNCQVITGNTDLLLTSPPFFGVWKLPLSKNNEKSLLTKISDNSLPTVYKLYQNYPNPFNPATIITYQLPNSNYVKLSVYDILGKEVAILVNEKQNAGTYKVEWNASNYPSGVYFYKLISGANNESKKMLLVK